MSKGSKSADRVASGNLKVNIIRAPNTLMAWLVGAHAAIAMLA
jgi:hypothetical protein